MRKITWLILFLPLLFFLALCQENETSSDQRDPKQNQVDSQDDNGSSLPPLPIEFSSGSILPGILGGVLLALIGVTFLLFGYKYLKKILFIIGAVAGAIIAYIILLNIEKTSSDPLFGDARSFIFAAICLGCGLVCGSLALALWRLGLVIAGGLGGLAAAMFLLSLPFINNELSSTIRPIFLAAFVALGGLGSLFFESLVIMMSTAMFGAGCICVCIDIYAKTGFCDAIIAILQNQGTEEMNASFAGLLISFLVLSATGFYLQYRGHLPSDRHHHMLIANQNNPVYKV